MTPEQVFGRSQYAIIDETGEVGGLHPALGRGETWAAEFTNLVAKDQSFEEFLIRKGIDPLKLNPSPDAPNGNTIRKIAPVVAFRNAYKGTSEGKKEVESLILQHIQVGKHLQQLAKGIHAGY